MNFNFLKNTTFHIIIYKKYYILENRSWKAEDRILI